MRWAMGLAVCLAGCSGSGAAKPSSSDSDSGTVADTETDTETETETDTDTDTGTYIDSGYRRYDPNLRSSSTGQATVTGSTWDGTETYRIEDLNYGLLCELVFQTQDLASSPLAGTAVTSDLTTCGYGSQACVFAFDVAHFNAELGGAGDCNAFGLSKALLKGGDYLTSYGFVENYAFPVTTSSGAPGTVTDSLMVYWVDLAGTTGTFLGWYPAIDSLYGVYYGFQDTARDGEDFRYTLDFSYYVYYL